jgi:hypothetical protein
VLVAEEELAIEIAQINRVEVDDVDLAEAGQDEVLEQLAADAAGAYHQHARLESGQLVARVSAGCVLPGQAGATDEPA